MTREEKIKKLASDIAQLLISSNALEPETTRVEKPKEVFSARQLQFSRDAQKQLLDKFNNQRYEAYRKEILQEIVKKYEHAKKQKSVFDDKVKIYENFLNELKTNTQKPEILLIDFAA
jgi:hypothetical protein